ncbi:phosphate ABC transporter permease PstA [Candidatus Liberibacter sp.]|uniref:phosphate ABC transporter permease PstA n=1 Tax=Candidatus Liberibacter sp. TaxID=34022 RepID=UPI0015F61A3A|nr:phosphate ABC transporter permease PstA [Candidatus Liberibacter sp.]MBA5723953.1 phosphate ABC transporter permease PstA [Candidatus Liberibacter sp.]
MRLFPLDESRLNRRYISEWFFRFCCVASVFIVLFFLVVLLFSIVSKGFGAFWQTHVSLPVEFSESIIDPKGERFTDPSVLQKANYQILARNSLAQKLGVSDGEDDQLMQVYDMLSSKVRVRLRKMLIEDPSLMGKKVEMSVLVSADVDSAFKGNKNVSKLSDLQSEWIRTLIMDGSLSVSFNYGFFANGSSSRPEAAGIGVAVIGSLYMLSIVMGFSLPLGIASALYLEEFASKNFFSSFIRANINNLASVPSIVYGIFGSAVLINFFKMPRSTPLVGGLVLALITLPSIIIATGMALKTVPSSIRSAALGLGASKVQTVFHHVLPLAIPGILTGSIVSLARALGETAPLLFIGMVAFVTDYPEGIVDTATALPIQIYLWTNDMERPFIEKAFGAIFLLLVFLAILNVTMLWVRDRFRKRW